MHTEIENIPQSSILTEEELFMLLGGTGGIKNPPIRGNNTDKCNKCDKCDKCSLFC